MAVYLLEADDGTYKIGRSQDPAGRARAISRPCKRAALVHVIATDNGPWLERTLHRRYAARHQGGEWFALSADEVAALKALSRVDQPPGERIPSRGNIPPEERMDLHVHPRLKALVIERADASDASMNEEATTLLCRALGLDPAAYRVPRKPPGRKAGRTLTK